MIPWLDAKGPACAGRCCVGARQRPPGLLARADPRPNVLLITVDTLRADYLGSYGFDQPTSPRVDALAAEGVLFTSDHGESFGEGGRYFVHGFATTPQLAHIPLILRAPGLSPERRRDPVHHVDVMPTLLELAGIEPPPGMSGRALGPYLREGRSLEQRIVFCDIGFELSAYRADSFLRVLGPDERQRGAEEERPAWLAFDWDQDGSWSVSEGSALEDDAEACEALRRYLSDRKAIEWAIMSPEELKLLRALGYVLTNVPDSRGAPDAR